MTQLARLDAAFKVLWPVSGLAVLTLWKCAFAGSVKFTGRVCQSLTQYVCSLQAHELAVMHGKSQVTQRSMGIFSIVMLVINFLFVFV